MTVVRFILWTTLVPFVYGIAQTPAQDSTLNNLVLPPGYETCRLGDLGNVEKEGDGARSMIVIPGLGFGQDVFESFAHHYEDMYTVYVVTPAGFGGTSAPPIPDSTVANSSPTWTNGIVKGVVDLIEKEQLVKPVIVAHFVTGTQVALNLALNYPEKIGRVVIISGSPYRYYASRAKNGAWDWDIEKHYTAKEREELVQTYWAPKWFKTVTKRTWDGNMWAPGDYCKDTLTGKELFEKSAEVPLQVMIRYLIEWMAYDVTERYAEIKVPVLVLIPDFDGISFAFDPTSSASPANRSRVYLKYFHQDPIWATARESGNPSLTLRTVPGTRIFMWYDNPDATYDAINGFVR